MAAVYTVKLTHLSLENISSSPPVTVKHLPRNSETQKVLKGDSPN